MKFVVTEMNNFARVFRLPSGYPEGFCFGGGYPVNFQLVDWLNPVPTLTDVCPEISLPGSDGMTKFPLDLEGESLEKLREGLRGFIKDKVYVKSNPQRQFLMITDYGDVFFVYQPGQEAVQP